LNDLVKPFVRRTKPRACRCGGFSLRHRCQACAPSGWADRPDPYDWL